MVEQLTRLESYSTQTVLFESPLSIPALHATGLPSSLHRCTPGPTLPSGSTSILSPGRTTVAMLNSLQWVKVFIPNYHMLRYDRGLYSYSFNDRTQSVGVCQLTSAKQGRYLTALAMAKICFVLLLPLVLSVADPGQAQCRRPPVWLFSLPEDIAPIFDLSGLTGHLT